MHIKKRNEKEDNMKETVTLGGVIKHTNGIGFKITCNNTNDANHIKDMLRWILVNEENKKIIYNQGYYDLYDEKGDKK